MDEELTVNNYSSVSPFISCKENDKHYASNLNDETSKSINSVSRQTEKVKMENYANIDLNYQKIKKLEQKRNEIGDLKLLLEKQTFGKNETESMALHKVIQQLNIQISKVNKKISILTKKSFEASREIITNSSLGWNVSTSNISKFVDDVKLSEGQVSMNENINKKSHKALLNLMLN